MEVLVTHEDKHGLVIEVGRNRISTTPVAYDGKCFLLAYRDVRGEWRFRRADSNNGDRINLLGGPMSLDQLPKRWLHKISPQRLPAGCPVPLPAFGPNQLELCFETCTTKTELQDQLIKDLIDHCDDLPIDMRRKSINYRRKATKV